jgi:putative hydrolase
VVSDTDTDYRSSCPPVPAQAVPNCHRPATAGPPAVRDGGRVSTSPAGAGRPGGVDLRADHHAPSMFSGGSGTVDQNVRAAEQAGLTRLIIVDRATADTDWLAAHRAVVRRAAARTDVAVSRGLETAILDTAGRLDLPDDLTGVDYLAVTEHGFPLRAGPGTVADVRLLLGSGMLDPAQALELLVHASVRALHRAAELAEPVLARPFGLLPEVGIDEELLTDDLLRVLAEGCLATGSSVAINERWRCPSPRVAATLAAAGVPLVAGSAARHPDGIGRWAYVRETAAALAVQAG